mmetsp:Transcript_41102/g.47363  ORF Transcript_41102/g.47363 Transcript_41102/m.47363 type:complete len:98 (+) Transcript_41102:1588-1881(+)
MNRGARFLSRNPYSLEVMKEHQFTTNGQYDSIFNKACSAYEAHKRTSYADRAHKIDRMADIIERRKREVGSRNGFPFDFKSKLLTLELLSPPSALRV